MQLDSFTRSGREAKPVISDLASSLRFEEPEAEVTVRHTPLSWRLAVSRSAAVAEGDFDPMLDAPLWGEDARCESNHTVYRLADGSEVGALELRDEVARRDGREREAANYSRRDEIAAWLEQKRRTEGDQHRSDGDYWGAGPVAEKRWLDAQIAQLRIDARELMADGRRKGFRVTSSDPQVQAIARQAQSLRHRHNFKRYVEALKCDPEAGGEDFAEAFEKAQAWRREHRLSYAKATEQLARVHRRRWYSDPKWVGVEGLIATA